MRLIPMSLTAAIALSTTALGQGLEPGRYSASGNTHFSDVRIDRWAGRQLVMTGTIHYGNYGWRFLFPGRDDGLWNGRGQFSVRYDDGIACTHDIRLDIYPDENGFFLKHWAPGSVYVEKTSGGPCPDIAAAYKWNRHPNQYVLMAR